MSILLQKAKTSLTLTALVVVLLNWSTLVHGG